MGVLLSSPIQWDFCLLKHAELPKEWLPFFLILVAQFCFVLQLPTCSQPGAKEVEQAGWVEDGEGKSQQGLCICQSKFSIEGRTHGKMFFYCKLPLCSLICFSLKAC